MTLPYAEVIGDPVAQSKSPIIHRFWLERLGLAGAYRRLHVPVVELARYLDRRRCDPDWRGCNVTIPHKQAVLPLLDGIEGGADRIGAANIVVREGEALVGRNSDAPGFLEPLQPWLRQRHLLRTARILGTGGAARAVAHALWQHGFTLVILGRDEAKANALADEFDRAQCFVAPFDQFASPLTFDWGATEGRLDLLVNATSLGMTGQPPLPIDFSHVPPGAIIYDIVYAPLETPLLAEARARGHPTVDGLAMLIGQARIAFRAFFGVDPPADADSDAQLRALLVR